MGGAAEENHSRRMLSCAQGHLGEKGCGGAEEPLCRGRVAGAARAGGEDLAAGDSRQGEQK